MAGRKAKSGGLVETTARRQPKFSPDVVTLICERLSDGEPLAAICRDPAMPGLRTVYDWMEADPEVAARIARARDEGEEAIAAECMTIADTPVAGERRKVTEGGVEVTTEDMLGHRKLQIWTRLQLLAKWNPKKWGDRQQIEHSGKIALESLVAGDGDK